MGKLSDGLKKKRRFPFEIAELKLTLIRPTAYQLAKTIDDISEYELAARFVVDWGEVKESDYVKGGSADPIKFNEDDWRELLQDRPELWSPIAEAIINSWNEHKATREESEKN